MGDDEVVVMRGGSTRVRSVAQRAEASGGVGDASAAAAAELPSMAGLMSTATAWIAGSGERVRRGSGRRRRRGRGRGGIGRVEARKCVCACAAGRAEGEVLAPAVGAGERSKFGWVGVSSAEREGERDE